ncbi:hypothetical protein VP1G_06727 [Cytospora mali]|uniref:Cyanovirin-N domain-containing protein n=1 Tax=Cytospora mali TaxID=578113 RepID=A0A194V6H8_CYTMA|nr:hypothetical protein VP1G_06727 [Valsa mali var. pyri (nom. inval.)]
MLRYAIPLSLLAGSVLGVDFAISCTNVTLDATTDVLTAACNIGDGKGTFDTTSINLNDCFAYGDDKLYPPDRNGFKSADAVQYQVDGNFGESCDDCFIDYIQDPVYLGYFPWLNCTCQGEAVSIDLGKVSLVVFLPFYHRGCPEVTHRTMLDEMFLSVQMWIILC